MGLKRRAAETPSGQERREHGRDLAGLTAQLSSPDAEERRRAALDLWGSADAVPALLSAYAVEADVSARDAMLTTLAGHDVPEVGRALALDLRAEDAVTRNTAVKALQTMPNAVAGIVEELLADADADVRVLSVMVVSAVAHPDVPLWLRPVVEADPQENVVAAAVDVAMTLGGEVGADFAEVAAARFPANPYLGFLASTAARP